MASFHPPNFSNSNDEENGIIALGWPTGVPFPCYQNGKYPISPVDPLKRTLKIFLGPRLDRNQEACIELLFDAHFRLNAKTEYTGLSITAYRTTFSPEKVGQVFQFIQNGRVGFSFELRVWEPVGGVEAVIRIDSGNDGRVQSSLVSGPADFISKPEEVRRIHALSNLHGIHILSPSNPLHTLEEMNACVANITSILSSPRQLRMCALPLDFFVRIRECLAVVAQYSDTMEELVLLAPTTFDLFRLLHADSGASTSSGPYLVSLLPSLSLLTSLQFLTIPIALVTAEFISCIARLPKLWALTIKPAENIYSIKHFLRAMEVSQIAVQGADTGVFSALVFLDLGLYDREYPQLRPDDDEEDANARCVLRARLPYTILFGAV